MELYTTFDNVSIPQEGVVFRTSPDQSAPAVLTRRGGSFIVLPQAQYQGNYDALPILGITGEMEQAMSRLRGGNDATRTILGTMADFQNLTPSGTSYSTKVSPVNPYGLDIFANGELLKAYPALGEQGAGALAASAPVVNPNTNYFSNYYSQQQVAQSPYVPTATSIAPSFKSPIAMGTYNSPAAVQVPTTFSGITGTRGLYETAAITSLEKKIQENLDRIAAGLPTTSTQILENLFTKFGVAKEQDLLNAYSQQILEKTQLLKKLPEDIQHSLENVGVSQAQLDRLVLKESQKPMEVLNDLMTQRGVAQERIQQSLQFVQLFGNAAMQDQAAKTELMKWEFEQNMGMYKELKEEQRFALGLVLSDQKDRLTLMADLANKGASQDIINHVRNSGNYMDALQDVSGFYQQYTDQQKLLNAANALLGKVSLRPETAGIDRAIIEDYAKTTGIQVNPLIDELERLASITPPSVLSELQKNQAEIEKKFAEQNIIDFQDVSSAYTTVQSILKKYGKNFENVTVADLQNMEDIDADSIGKALARAQNPGIARLGQDPGNAFEPESWQEKMTAWFRKRITGKRYLPQKIYIGIRTTQALYEGRGATVGITPGVTQYPIQQSNFSLGNGSQLNKLF